jgi:D-3-phosphoglycerate dehydrogenase
MERPAVIGTAPPLAAGAQWRILNAECGRFSAEARTALQALGQVDEVEADRDFLLQHVADYDVLVVALRNTIDAALLEHARRLKVIVTPTTGLNHIDQAAARSRNITILSLQGETGFLNQVSATAELTWGLLLALLRHIPAAHASVMQGRWDRNAFYGHELKDKTLGIVGCGRLGSMVARYGLAFRMSVLAHDIRPAEQEGVAFVALPELLQRSDVVSLHLPLNDATRNFFDACCFARMKQGAVLLNTARGELVDTSALLDALGNGRVAGAAMDVLADETSLDPEWLGRHPLASYARTHGNVLISPHIGGVTHESVSSTNLFMIRKLERYVAQHFPVTT